MGNKIVDWALYGEHIPLTCKNHPTLRWHTKNIEFIGARTIFRAGPDCGCPQRDLRPLTQEEAEKERKHGS